MDFDYTIQGELPVRVLRKEIIRWFESINESLREDIANAEQYETFNPIINYNTPQNIINDIAFIDDNSQIQLFENYNQYLWSISYFLLVVYDNCLQGPMMKGNYKGEFNFEQQENKIAKGVFIAGLNLTVQYVHDCFYRLPNCEIPTQEFTDTIGHTNGVFVSSLSFIIAHEFAHHYYQHDPNEHDSTVLISREFDADNLAIHHIKETFARQEGYNYKVGIITALCSFLFLYRDKSALIGDDAHPDWDERMKNAIEQLDLPDEDNIWGLAGFSMVMWMNNFKEFGDDAWPEGFNTYRDSFYFYLSQITQIKHRLFPKMCKPDWDV